jgi:acetyl-CoA synthetase
MRPKTVLFVADLPKTRNAKIMRRVIRAAYLGLPTGDLTSLENPAAVEQIAALGGH